VFAHDASDLFDVGILTAKGVEHITVTSKHPFYVEGRGWIPVGELEEGAALWSPNGLSLLASRRAVPESRTVYTFEVPEDHAYLVGDAAVLVHNASSIGMGGPPPAASPAGGTGGIGPVLKGQAGVAKSEAAAVARGETVLGREVTFDTTGGRIRADLLTEDTGGNLKVIDAKNGPSAGLTPNQQTGYPALQRTGGVPRGANAAAAGLTPGQPTGPIPVQIDHW
jgi:hypothetical protein